jgi:hypothetical protein
VIAVGVVESGRSAPPWVLAGPGGVGHAAGHLWFTALQIAPWAIIDAKLAVDAAARQAARHFVEADVPATDDVGEAEADARLAGYEAWPPTAPTVPARP